MRIAVAIEIEVPDGTDLAGVTVSAHGYGLAVDIKNGERTALLKAVRWEVHPDPDAVFGREDEELQRQADAAREDYYRDL